ncbi:MAG: hypothetical protein Q9218_007701, partial [Villophora microphyllina]
MGPEVQASYQVSVLDLPQLYTKPSATQLLSTLGQLELRNVSWDGNDDGEGHKINEDGIPKYLTCIIASKLAWIEDEITKEQIWEAASARLSERSGRSAMRSLSRVFVIPAPDHLQSVSIKLHEPSLTADNLGHKTWLSSYLLAKRLPAIIPHLPPLQTVARNPDNRTTRVIELGAGT